MSRRSVIVEVLRSADHAMTASEISAVTGFHERTISCDLEHIAKTLKARGQSLLVRRAFCAVCGFAFPSSKISSPRRCPRCRSPRIQDAAFAIGSREERSKTSRKPSAS